MLCRSILLVQMEVRLVKQLLYTLLQQLYVDTVFKKKLFFYVHLGLVYCMDYLEKNIDWLESKMKPLLDGEHKNSQIFLWSYQLFYPCKSMPIPYHEHGYRYPIKWVMYPRYYLTSNLFVHERRKIRNS